MKAIKHYLAALLLTFIALPALTSCGSDDEEKNPFMPINPENSFVGTTTTWPSDNPDAKYTSTKSVYNVVFDTDNKIGRIGRYSQLRIAHPHNRWPPVLHVPHLRPASQTGDRHLI